MSGTVLIAAETSGNKTKDSVSIATYIQGAVEKKAYKGSNGVKCPGVGSTGRRASTFLCGGGVWGEGRWRGEGLGGGEI